MVIAIKVDVEKVSQAFRRFPQEMSAVIRVEMRNQMAGVQALARSKPMHRFTTRTAMLERSILSHVLPSGLTGEVYLNTGIAPYGVYVHEGHHLKSLRGGWKPDQFVYAAFKARLPQIISIMAQAIEIALKRVGLK